MTRSRTKAALVLAACLVIAATAQSGGAVGQQGRFIGGGFIEDPNIRVHNGLELPCAVDVGGASLEVNQGANHFHLTRMTAASCTFGGNGTGTHSGAGIGRCDDGSEATIEWTVAARSGHGLIDPKTSDFARFDITGGGCALSVTGPLVGGNYRMIEDPNL